MTIPITEMQKATDDLFMSPAGKAFIEEASALVASGVWADIFFYQGAGTFRAGCVAADQWVDRRCRPAQAQGGIMGIIKENALKAGRFYASSLPPTKIIEPQFTQPAAVPMIPPCACGAAIFVNGPVKCGDCRAVSAKKLTLESLDRRIAAVQKQEVEPLWTAWQTPGSES
jgi:hypothetical protein